MHATRDDVARIARVSGPTVSYVFNGTRKVSEETRQRVLKAAEQLKYQPDMVARAMITGRTNTIGILTDDISNPLIVDMTKGIQEAAIDNGYFVHLCGGVNDYQKYIDNFISRRVDGVFVSVNKAAMSETYIWKLLDHNISVITTATRNDEDPRICRIESDFQSGMLQILHHLHGLGHYRIAYLSAFDDTYAYDCRLSAFKEQFGRLFPKQSPIIVQGKPPYASTMQTGYEMAQEILGIEPKVTAIVCTNDLMAMGAIKRLAEAGMRVPQDVSVVGIDNIFLSAYSVPALTTLDTCPRQYGRRIFHILYNNILRNEIVNEVYETKLLVRESTALAKSF